MDVDEVIRKALPEADFDAMQDHDLVACRKLVQAGAAYEAETIARLRFEMNELMLVVEDFLPNVGRCALQNYERLNTALIAGAANRRVLESEKL